MNITTDFKHSSPSKSLSEGGYEWWYFDGQSREGDFHFVIIFYKSNPFSTKYIENLTDGIVDVLHPAISVSVYHKGKPVYYSFLEFGESDFSWDEQEMELKVGGDLFNYRPKENKLLINIELDQKLASRHGIQGTLKGEGRWSNPRLIHSESNDRHAWNLLLPHMDWEVDLAVEGKKGSQNINFSGIGYHDHNTGQEPMKESFRDWYWGRYHFKDFTLVYYLMQKHGEEQMEAWLIDQNNKTVLEYFTDSELSDFGRNLFGLRSARKIELKSNQATVNIQYRNKIDDGPFYQRFIGDSIIKYKDQVFAAHGVSEYIYPKNIYNEMFWPLVHMRLRFMKKKPHWVQKSPLMYPWTW